MGGFEYVDSTFHVVRRDCSVELKIKEPGYYYIIPSSTGVEFANRKVDNCNDWAESLVTQHRFESDSGFNVPNVYVEDGHFGPKGSPDTDSDGVGNGYAVIDFMGLGNFDDVNEVYLGLNKLYLNENKKSFSPCISRIFDEIFDRFVSSSNMEDALMSQQEMDAFVRQVSHGEYGVSERTFGTLRKLAGDKTGLSRKDFKNAQFNRYLSTSRYRRVHVSELIENDLIALGYDPKTLYHNDLKHVYLSVHSERSLDIQMLPFDTIVFSAAIELPLIYKGIVGDHFGGLGRMYSSDISAGRNMVNSYLFLNNSEKDSMKVTMKANDDSVGHDLYISTKLSINTETVVPPSGSKIINNILPLKVEKLVKAAISIELVQDMSITLMSPPDSNNCESHYGGTMRGRGIKSQFRMSQRGDVTQQYVHRGSEYIRSSQYHRASQYNGGSQHIRGSQYHPFEFQSRGSKYHKLSNSHKRNSRYYTTGRIGSIQELPSRNGSIHSIINIPKYRKKSEFRLDSNYRGSVTSFDDASIGKTKNDAEELQSVDRNLFCHTASTMDII